MEARTTVTHVSAKASEVIVAGKLDQDLVLVLLSQLKVNCISLLSKESERVIASSGIDMACQNEFSAAIRIVFELLSKPG